MKKQIKFLATTLAFTCATMLSMNSCTKLGKNLQYDLDMQTASVDVIIPAYGDTTISVSGSQTVFFNIDSFIKANTANLMGVVNIKSAKIKSCVLTLVDPTPAINFANFKSCSGYFYTSADNTPFGVSIPSNPDVYAASLALPVDTAAELKGYLSNGNQFTYSLGGKLRRATNKEVHCTATFTFKVHVQGI